LCRVTKKAKKNAIVYNYTKCARNVRSSVFRALVQ